MEQLGQNPKNELIRLVKGVEERIASEMERSGNSFEAAFGSVVFQFEMELELARKNISQSEYEKLAEILNQMKLGKQEGLGKEELLGLLLEFQSLL